MIGLRDFHQTTGMCPRLVPLLIVLTILGFWPCAMIGRSIGQEAPIARPTGADLTTTQSAGSDAAVVRSLADLLRSQSERSEKAVQATADSVRAYADLLRKEAEVSAQSTKHELDTIERTLGRFVSVVQTFGWLLSGIAFVTAAALAFFNFGSVRDIRRQARAAFARQLEGAQTTFAQQSDEARKRLEALEGDAQKRADDLNKRFSGIEDELDSLDDDSTKVSSDLVLRREKLAQSRDGVTPPEPEFKGKSIIWVDDQPKTTLTAREELARYGIKATAVDDTHRLKEKLARALDGKQFDLIVSDMGRGPNPRAGLDYFKTISGKGLPKRLIFDHHNLVRPVEGEILELQHEDGNFLGAVTANEPFFAKVFEVLRSA